MRHNFKRGTICGYGGPLTAPHADGPGGPSMAAILGPGGPSTATYFAADGPGDLFWGDHLWHDRTCCTLYDNVLSNCDSALSSLSYVHSYIYICACVFVCVCACVHACVCVCTGHMCAYQEVCGDLTLPALGRLYRFATTRRESDS